MRTTLDIDEDLLGVTKDMARQEGKSMGQVVSELVRKALQPSSSKAKRNGVLLFTPVSGAKKPYLQLVNRLRDGE